MTTAAERVEAFATTKPPQMDAADVPAVPEIVATLRTAARGNYRNLYKGWLDVAGTVRTRVYIGGDSDEHKGEILVGTSDADVTFSEFRGEDDSLAYFEYRNTLAPDTLVMVWVPRESEHDGIKITL